MWTVRNNLKGALKFTDIFIGGKPIILKSRGFLDLDLIDGGRRSAEMSEQLKRCYDENYIRDIHRTNTPEEVVHMNLRDLENIAQKNEIEELKSKLKDGGTKMDEILAAIQNKTGSDTGEDLIALKSELQNVIEQIQTVASDQNQGLLKDELNGVINNLKQSDTSNQETSLLEASNKKLHELLEAQDQKIDALNKSIHDNHQTVKIEESDFDFNEKIEAFEDSTSDQLQKQRDELQQIKAMLLEKQKESEAKQHDAVQEQLQLQQKQMDELMSMLKKKENPVQQQFGISAEEQRQVLKNQLLQQRQMDQIANLIQQKVESESKPTQEASLLEKQLEMQQDQIKKLTELMLQKEQPAVQENQDQELQKKLELQQLQLQKLTELMESKQELQKEPSDDASKDMMEKNLALQQEQLLNISQTMQELKEKDAAHHEDMVDLKVLMAQHQNGNTFSKVVKTLSSTDIEAALKVSDQIDDRIKDKSFEVTKKTKQKVDHPDVSELLGDTDLDFE